MQVFLTNLCSQTFKTVREIRLKKHAGDDMKRNHLNKNKERERETQTEVGASEQKGDGVHHGRTKDGERAGPR